MYNVILSLLIGSAIFSFSASAAVEITLAEKGQALHPIIVAPTAGERTRQAADELADYLERITGAPFVVETGDGSRGLAIGPFTDFPGLDLASNFQPDEPFRQDDYLLRSHTGGLHLTGASELAAHLAVWDLLHRLGYRLYFLTDTWEIVPERPELKVAVDVVERPDYVTRDAPRGAPWTNRELWQRWRLRNRITASFALSTGHAYDTIIRHNRAAFDANPDFFALIDGERKTTISNPKFCISNPGLRQLVVDYAVRQLRKNPAQVSVSMDPSDGGNWCECDNCAAMGSVTDRALTLANDVAEAINELGLGSRYVGMYGYNQHSPPPAIESHPNVVISVATSFIRGGYTIEELVEGWRAKGPILGIRDYHDVFTWSHDLPRRARGGNLAYLTRTIPYFHQQGARFMNSENADSWGANGLGYWLTPRLLWDVDAVDEVDSLVEDFLTNAFGAAANPMRDFYVLINRDHQSVRSTEDVVARMYRHLDDARQATTDPRVLARLDDLILYTRYTELYHAYRQASGEARQHNFEQVWRHAYRMRDRMMLSTVAICHRGRAYRDKSIAVPEEAHWSVPEEANPWKSGKPFGTEEIAAILTAGLAANQPTVLDFDLVGYSEELVPASRLALSPVKLGSFGAPHRGRQRFHTWLPEGRESIELKVTGGLIVGYRDRGNVKITLYAEQEATLEPVAEDESVPPDGVERIVQLRTPYTGLHTLEWNDGSDMTRVIFPEDLPFTVRSTLEDPMRPNGRWTLSFYVPRGTKVVGGYAGSNLGLMLDGNGNQIFDFADMDAAGYFRVDVPPGQDGKLWTFANSVGPRMLMTVPPYLAPSGDHLLLPREVVTADAQ